MINIIFYSIIISRIINVELNINLINNIIFVFKNNDINSIILGHKSKILYCFKYIPIIILLKLTYKPIIVKKICSDTIVLHMKRDNATTPWGMKFEGGQGTGKPIVATVSYYECFLLLFFNLFMFLYDKYNF